MSAVAIKNPENSLITIEAHIIFYGKYAEPILAEKIVAEINTMWNEPVFTYIINNQNFKVKFLVDFECLSNADVIPKVLSNQDYRNNFIRIEDKNTSERSMMGFGLGENSGHWLITDNLGESTTAAHEFGHAMNLPHPEQIDFRNSGFPPIMAPRGTIVDAEFQWNPLAEPGEFGGTMQPAKRRVRFYEIKAILDTLDLVSQNEAPIGKLTNLLFDEIGQIGSIINA